ncbi:hypothetical protein L245_00240 [Salmonella enterica subsp. enterica serovar Worthington str. BCH-4719]|nr:hypothetical protein L245_00240 [Salmonella enterica subsp. enterica serovar Worthington str. BCH-4719]
MKDFRSCINERRVFNFNDEQYEEFINLLDAPVADDPVIEKLLLHVPLRFPCQQFFIR